ncbi:MAG: hypothetical protein OEL81_03855 [Nitrosopumilus sp.]|nr:hypothetical protein [Nitrosopumilus sp.]
MTKTVGSSTHKKIFHYDSNESIIQINNLTDGYVKKIIIYKNNLEYRIKFKISTKSTDSEDIAEVIVLTKTQSIMRHLKLMDNLSLNSSNKYDISEEFDEKGNLKYKAIRKHLHEDRFTTITEIGKETKKIINLLYRTEFKSNDSSTYVYVIQEGYEQIDYDDKGNQLNYEKIYFNKHPKKERNSKYYESYYFPTQIWKFLKIK